ncbi:anhydro-N-acetylmuramic acid kinase [Meridianimaribacter flavus]|uniref:Anhydro-N-acetylmuramic acid kinase n=1 Tax=Meridianimaribacter flavus TaxID=571115 RepID=A0ABY2G492_9FLAO|nr:anhydro-N-acetylmuramic acid kinase [Meridianimaribacter flavus]TDY11609.1 anhydro-N-acetylmuramic acid kinase [Meridianimaribacter flavus]
MIKETFKVIGVMSGTSLDGIDLIYVQFNFDEKWTYTIYTTETVSYTQYWENTLKHLVSNSKQELKDIDDGYTVYLAEVINSFIKKHHIETVDAICSHGHTALHQPQSGMTYQIGNLPKISKLLKHTVVCDFRVQDVELGGQGAPLVPIGDKLLFSDYDFCLNLGGFANISTEIDDTRIAYDICPVNIVLNHYVKPLGFNYDNEGQIAKSGKLHTELLNQLNDLDFYSKSHPKSLGLEWVKQLIFPIIDAYDLPIETILRTFTEHVAVQISKEINTKHNAKVLVSGGGAYNKFLLDLIVSKTKNSIELPSKEIIEFKEALIFGLLGVLKLKGAVNCLKSVTGAKKNHSSGRIYYP